jgi:uncharacterized membrane protein
MKQLSRRQFGIILIVSLAANLFLAGLVAGDWIMGRVGPRPPFGPATNFGWMRHAIGSDAEKIIEPVMQQHRDAMRRQMEGVRATRRDVGAALTAEPFDRARLESALARLRSQAAEAQTAFHGTFVDVVSNLTPEQRAALAKESQRRRRGPF